MVYNNNMEKQPAIETEDSKEESFAEEHEGGVLRGLSERGPKIVAMVTALGLLTAQAEKAHALEVGGSMTRSGTPVELNHPERYCNEIDQRFKESGTGEKYRIILGPNGAAVVQMSKSSDGRITRWTAETTSRSNKKLRVNCQ